MPQLGLGLYKLPDGDVTYNSVMTALKIGYRHFDCAHAYQNEGTLGRAIKDSGVPREELWITSKLWINELGTGKTLESIDRMLGRFGLEYLDMIYFHQAIGDFVEGWKELEQALEKGKVRSIGISNFDAKDELFDKMISSARIKPQALQLECHPYAQREHWQERCAKEGIQIEAWFPLGGRDSGGEILRDETICAIAKKHEKSPAQVIIRWHIQKGFSVIPGSSNPANIRANFEALSFVLTDEEMEQIHALNKEKRYFTMAYDDQVKYLSSWKPAD